MKLRHTTTILALAAVLLGADGEGLARPGAAPRDIKYAQSSTHTGAVKAVDDGRANAYPVLPQSAAVEQIGRRLANTNLLVVQGDSLLPGAAGTVERFTIRGAVRYELELEVVYRDAAPTPAVRDAIADALAQTTRQSVNVRRVHVGPRAIELETDAGRRKFARRPDEPAQSDG